MSSWFEEGDASALRLLRRRAVFAYLVALFATCLYASAQIWRDKTQVEAFLGADLDAGLEEDPVAALQRWVEEWKRERRETGRGRGRGREAPGAPLQEGMKKAKDPFAKITGLVKSIGNFFKSVVAQFKKLAPRIAFLSVAGKNARQALISSNRSVEAGIVGGFAWFKRHVKWLERVQCYPLYLLNAVLVMIGSALYACLAAFLWVCSLATGVPLDADPYLAELQALAGALDPGIEYVTKCYACDGCLPQAEVDRYMKQLAPAHFANAKTYFRRADCALQKAVAI